MTRRFNPLARSCSHKAVFSLTYLRTTEEYRRTVEEPTFFSSAAIEQHLIIAATSYSPADTVPR
jgi:hypothetical protein